MGYCLPVLIPAECQVRQAELIYCRKNANLYGIKFSDASGDVLLSTGIID